MWSVRAGMYVLHGQGIIYFKVVKELRTPYGAEPAPYPGVAAAMAAPNVLDGGAPPGGNAPPY